MIISYIEKTLPRDWDLVELQDIAHKVMVGIASAATHAYRETGIPMIRNTNIKVGSIDTSDILYIDPIYAKSHKNKALKEGDVITVRTGYPGVSAVVPPALDGAQCFTSLITRPRKDKIISEYLCSFINSPVGERQFEIGQAGGAQKNVNASTLSQMYVPLPSIGEQGIIIHTLSRWDRALDLIAQMIDAKQQRLIWLLQQLLTGKRRLPGFRSKWRKTTVGEIAEEVSIRNKGKFGIDKVRAVNKSEGMIPMKSHVIADDLSRYKVVERTWFAYNPMRIKIGSICQLMGEEKALVSPDYVVFRCKEQRIDHRFFNAFRRSHRWQSFMDASGNGSVRVRIYFEDLARLTMLLPSLDEQRSIADFISLADREIELLRVQLDALSEQKKGLMQQLLTGKVRVKV